MVVSLRSNEPYARKAGASSTKPSGLLTASNTLSLKFSSPRFGFVIGG
jgi:hypothetical protein